MSAARWTEERQGHAMRAGAPAAGARRPAPGPCTPQCRWCAPCGRVGIGMLQGMPPPSGAADTGRRALSAYARFSAGAATLRRCRHGAQAAQHAVRPAGLIGGKAARRGAAADMARAPLDIADLARDPDDPAGDVSEELAHVATRCMLNFFEDGAALLEHCLAQTERERAAFLIGRLVGRRAALGGRAGRAGRRIPPWLPPLPAAPGLAQTWKSGRGSLRRQYGAGAWQASLARRRSRRFKACRAPSCSAECAGRRRQAHSRHGCTGDRPSRPVHKVAPLPAGAGPCRSGPLGRLSPVWAAELLRLRGRCGGAGRLPRGGGASATAPLRGAPGGRTWPLEDEPLEPVCRMGGRRCMDGCPCARDPACAAAADAPHPPAGAFLRSGPLRPAPARRRTAAPRMGLDAPHARRVKAHFEAALGPGHLSNSPASVKPRPAGDDGGRRAPERPSMTGRDGGCGSCERPAPLGEARVAALGRCRTPAAGPQPAAGAPHGACMLLGAECRPAAASPLCGRLALGRRPRDYSWQERGSRPRPLASAWGLRGTDAASAGILPAAAGHRAGRAAPPALAFSRRAH